MYFVYIIKSTSLNLHYIGHSSNLEDRLKRHNENRSNYTKGKGPWVLVESSCCTSKSDAYQLELKLKSFKNSEKAINYLRRLNNGVEHSD
jgi:putative endonuclease